MAVQSQFYSETSGLPICLQDWAGNQVYGMDSGSLFSLPYPQETQFQQHQINQSFDFDCNQRAFSPSPCNNFLSMSISQALNTQLEIQRHEIDRMLLSQNERLRHAMQDQRKEHVAILLSNLESKSLSLIRQKEEDLARATKKIIELENCLRKAEMESEGWQRLAEENEATVLKLTNTLEHVRGRAVLDNNRSEDTESCCGLCNRRDREQEEMERQCKRMVCKSCNSQSSSIVFLPCRHLCSCYLCEALLEFCPVCKSAKEGCMEVFLA